MNNLQRVLEEKEAHFLKVLREIEALRRAVRLLAEDADPNPYNASSAVVESAKTGNVSDTQQPPPADFDLNPLSDLGPLTDAERAILNDPAQWNSGVFLKS